MKLKNVLIVVKDIEKSKQFYHDLFGLAVVISFGCYIPVVLFADLVPPVGMLMIPKTCAYVWVVLIGYNAMKESNGR